MATIDYTAGNIDVTFFPTNTGAVRFCDKSVGGVNIATNNDTLVANTIKIGNSSTTTALAGAVTASGTVTLAGTVSVSGALTAPTPTSDSIGTQVTTAAWVRTFITSFLETIQTFTLGIRISTIYGKATETAFALWSEIAGSSITLGNGSTITLSGTTIANTVSSSAVGTTLALGENITTGAVEIGKNQAALGTITIGSSNSKTTMNGNVGIGKTASAYALDVSGTAQFTNSICSNANFGNWNSYYDVNGEGKNYRCLSTNIGGVGLYDFALYQDTGSTTLNSAAKLRFNIGDVEKMTMLTNGNVGIGTMSPSYKLDVSDDSKISSWVIGAKLLGTQLPLSNSTYAMYQDASSTFINTVSSGYIGFRVNNDQKMTILPSGNVGIGTTTPVYSLDVSGTALVKKALGNTASFGKIGIGSPVTEASLTASYVVASGPTLTNGEYFTTLTVGYGLLTLSIPYSLEANKSATIIITCRSNQSDMFFRVTNLSSGWLYTSSVISTTATTYTFTITNGATASAYLLLYAHSETNTSSSNRQFIYSKFSLYPEPSNTLDVDGTVKFSATTASTHGFILKANTPGNVVDSGTVYDFQSKAPFYIHDSGFPLGSGMGMKMGIFRNSGYGYINVETGNTGGSYHLCLQTHESGSNVGIGTASPSYKLDVNGTSRLGSWAMGSVSNVDLKALGTNLPLSLTNYALYQDNVNTYLNTPTGGSISFNIQNSTKWGIKTSGNLYQNGSTGDLVGINLPNNGAGIHWANGASRIVDDGQLRICSDDYIFFQTGCSSTSLGTAKMTILASGNVGIGTTDPSSTLDVAGRIKTNEISYSYSTNPTLSSTSLGYSVKSDFGSGGVAQGGNYTLASFTNQPIGIYLLTVGPTTVFGFIGGERCDISFETTTGFASFTTFNTMENGGNSAEKLGICFSMPVKVTLATNQLTVKLNAVVGDYSITGGSSSLTRIA